MLKIGITGSMGSGKSTIARVFESFGIPVYYTDEIAKKLYNSDPLLKEKIKLNFGNEMYDSNDKLMTPALAKKVFHSPEKLALLNSIVHPLVIADFVRWSGLHLSKFIYVIKEAALLFESNADKVLDQVICVVCPLEIRIERIKKRNP